MKWLTFEIQRAPGFRFNLIDIGLIAVLFGVAYGLNRLAPDTSLFWVPLYLGLSFFLFCNVFRIGNRLEPWWYIPFVLVAIYAIRSVDLRFFWMAVLLVLEPIKWVLIGIALSRDSYHGIGHAWLARRRGRRP